MMRHLSRPRALVVPLLASAALAAGLLPAVADDEGPAQSVVGVLTEPDTTSEPEARGLIVKLTPQGDLDEVAEDAEASLPDGVDVADTTGGTQGLGLIQLDEQVDTADLDDTIEQIEARPDVEWVAPNGVRYAAAVDNPNSQQWDLKNAGWGIRAESAWTNGVKGSGAVVAVVDTGITSHQDLNAQVYPGRDFVDDEYWCLNSSCSSISYRHSYISANDGNGWDSNNADPGDGRNAGMCRGAGPADSTWHGTHVAGTVAAAQNGVGVSGVAPAAKVVPVRVLGRCGGTDWDIAMGVLWAAGENVTRYDRTHGAIGVNAHPAKVINLSLAGEAGNASSTRQLCNFYSSVAQIARSRGAVMVAAAGNAGVNMGRTIPATCAGFISVAASTKSGARAYYSNYGSGLDIAAPGGSGLSPQEDNILSSWNAGSQGPSGATNTYGWMAGTSMAAPHVAGVAALIYGRGVRSPDVIERVLKATARKSSACSTAACGAGIVDAQNAAATNAPVSGPAVSGLGRPGRTLTLTSTGTWLKPAALTATWYRGSKPVRTGATYRVSAADLGQTVTVRITAAGTTGAIYASRATAVAKARSKVRVTMPSKVKSSKRATLRVKVSAPYVRPTGSVRVFDGKKRIATKWVSAGRNGRVKIKIRTLKKGTHRIRVVYVGNPKVASAKSRVKVVRSR